SNSLTKFPLFFILKKDKRLRLIINYKRLNEIIKKHYYSLLFITKLKDLFYKAN
ncbi:uncharacterized protein CLUP02_12782, partial [Colletotrichum lupini]